MIRGYSAEQIRAAEEPHLRAGEPLMARAAAGLADVIRQELDAGVGGGARVGRDARAGGGARASEESRAGVDARARALAGARPGADPGTPPRVLVLVGSGNNGGDALFAVAQLAASGCDVAIAKLGSRVHEDGLAAALAAGARVVGSEGSTSADVLVRVVAEAGRCDVVVDGILGTGAYRSPALRGLARDAVAAVRAAVAVRPEAERPGALVVAVDLPSGIDPDTGAVPDGVDAETGEAREGVVLPADVTVTFGAHKAGLLREPAAALAGRIVLVDIGLGLDLEDVEPLIVVEG
ncbi:NAD(P)H-hydrate epimerase [Humibacter albus]|uniref:NAD(P)H-hydrate epimerase n=1 Tax=Humibacter albus TaxID=427754 RepID=UPI0003B4057A|nr:NAD(P)H-hydrate epimerase [Humibacter albus]